MAIRDGIGKVKKSAPKIGSDTQDLQRVVDTIYRDINSVIDSVNRPNATSLTSNSKGKSGDIRLYAGAGQDGSIGYFLQGKFKEGWATVHLSLEEKNPENIEVSDPDSQSEGPEPFITKYGVNFNNLQVNSTVGPNADQVSPGNHQHLEHWGGAYVSGTHLNDIHFTLATANQDTSSLLDDVSSSSGDSIDSARKNHTHKINTSHSFTWNADQTFGSAYGGTTGKTVTINGPETGNNEYALDVKGDVSIDGELLVSYGETQSNAVTLSGNVTMNSDNISGSGNFITYNNKTRIYGPTRFDAGVKISKQSINANNAWHYDTTADDGKPPFIIENDSAEGQMRLQYDTNNYFDFKIDNSGNLLMDTIGNIQLRPNGNYVLPKGNLETHLGDSNRQWASIHAGELVVQNIMATNIMSTIGGQLRVAPTSKIAANLAAATTDYIYLKHNDPNFQNAWIFLQKADLSASDEGVGSYSYINGVVQFESIRTKATAPVSVGTSEAPSYKYEIETRNGDGGVANDWIIDDAVVVLYKLSAGGSKGFIELTSTGSVFNTYGPRITLFGAKEGDTAWNAAKPIVAIGNLRSYADYNGTDDNNFGMILSDDATKSTIEMKGMTLDQNNGMRLFNTDIEMYDNGTKKVELLNDGRFRLGSSLTLDGSGQWSSGDNVGLSWDPSGTLTINGIINITGGIYPDGSNVLDLPGSVGQLQTDLNNLDTSGMDDFSAAQQIINLVGGNAILDWDMEFDPGNDSSYNDMTLWGGTSNNLKQKSTQQVFQGTKTLRIASQHQSNVVTGGTQAHVDAYQTDVLGNDTCIPIVPGMKISVKGWLKIVAAVGNPGAGQFSFGVKVYNPTKLYYTWVKLASNQGVLSETLGFVQHEGTWTAPQQLSMKNSAGQSSTRDVAYVQPWLQGDTWGSAGDTQYSATLEFGYWDNLIMEFDSALAQPASPSGDAGFFAGSDLFGIHDGTNWRIQFSIDNQETSDTGNSYMALRNSAGNKQVSWDGDTFDIKGALNVSGSSDDINLSDGNITLGSQGTIRSSNMSFSTANSTGGFFLGVDSSGDSKFLVKNNGGDGDSHQQYIKVDTGGSTAVEIKGSLHADRLANVTPKIYDGVNYRPLTIVQSEFDGPLDQNDGAANVQDHGGWENDCGFTSDAITIPNVRNGALIHCSIYAEADDYQNNASSKVFWINPRIAYHSKSMDNTGDLNLHSRFHWPNSSSNWRLAGNWKEVDWVNNHQSMNTANDTEGVWCELGEPYNGTDSYWNQGNNNVGTHDHVVAWKRGNLFPSGSYHSSVQSTVIGVANSENIGSGNSYFVQFRMKPGYTANATQQAIISEIWAMFTNVNFDPDIHYLATTGDRTANYIPGPGWDNVGYDHGLRTTDERYIPPAYYSAGMNLNSGWGSAGIEYKAYGHNGDKEDLWQNMTYAGVGENMLFRLVNAGQQSWTSTETGHSDGVKAWSQFRHTYVFYVDIPGLESMTDPGEIQLVFGTGTPFSKYATWNESVGIAQTDFKITVFNQG